jgi:molecular chaperone DnaJ
MSDPYVVLAVGRDASPDEIKKSYRQLARECHPDLHPNDPDAEARFKELSAAYDTLSDPDRKARYDMYGDDGGSAGGFGNAAGFDFGGIFDAFFGGNARGPAGPMRGADAETRMQLTFEEAAFGVTRSIDVRMPIACPDCEATGCAPGTYPERCSVCDGQGEVRQVRRTVLGQMVTASPCHNCGATGQVIPTPCPTCRGDGRINGDRTLEVEIPAGIATGQRLRLNSRGPAVQPHEWYVRDGDDLIGILSIPMTQAALGAHVTIETLDGSEDLAITPGTQPGREFRLKGRGIPSLRGRGRGDILVRINVVIPEKLDADEAGLLRDFASRRGEEIAPEEHGFFKRIKSAFQ